MPGQHSQPTSTSFSQGYACLGVTCHLHIGRMPGIFHVPPRLHEDGTDTE